MNKIQEEELNILIKFDDMCKKLDVPYFLYAGTLLGAYRHNGFIPWDDDVDVILRRKHFDRMDQYLSNQEVLPKGYHYQSNRYGKHFNAAFSKLRNNTMEIKERVPKTIAGNHGPWVDLFPYDNIPDEEELRRKQYKSVSKYIRLIKFFTTMQEKPDKTNLSNKLKRVIRILNEKLYRYYFFMPYLYKRRLKFMTMYNDKETTHSADFGYMFYKNYEEFERTFIANSNLVPGAEHLFENRMFPVPLNSVEILEYTFGDFMVLPPEEERKTHNIIPL